jgi:hypothetical protein
MSTVAISVPSFTVFTLFALNPLIAGLLPRILTGINSRNEGGYPYSSDDSIVN